MSTHEQDSQRLNKYLAFHLGISRRKADELIEQGLVTVNDTPAGLGSRVIKPQAVAVRNSLIVEKQAYTYIAFNKPAGYVCSRRQQGDIPTIYALLPSEYHHLKPVGRLDADSSGIILLTDDGDFAQNMTHPKYYKLKHYEIVLDRELQPLHQQMINDFGVQLEDGPSKLTLERASDDNRLEWKVIMSEGRNRQIRRTFASLGYTVTKLHRTTFGSYDLSGLSEGKYERIIHHATS
ncbi:rRNA pseudouridine synthase [Candidatus Saccharibacteria bacterium]|nr:rRNA pseudouridine synthase [Candidatus Saccharibacteria bacterium]